MLLLNARTKAPDIYFPNILNLITRHKTKNQDEETSNNNYKTTKLDIIREHWSTKMDWIVLALGKQRMYIRNSATHYIYIIAQEKELAENC